MSFLSALVAPALSILASLNFGPSFGYSNQTEPDGTAYLEIRADENTPGVEVEISGDDGFHLEQTVNVRGGKPYRVTWKQKGKTVNYTLKMVAGDEQTDFNFEVLKPTIAGDVKGFELLSGREDIVDKGKISYRTSFALSSQELKVYSTSGEVIEDKTETQDIGAGDSFTMTWDSCDEVFMVKFRGEDDAGRYAEDTRVPWSFDVPHTDVIFDSGKADIKANESPKLDESFAILVNELEALSRAGKAGGADLTPQLYIIGYTDTVGSPADNKKLSEARARSISQYFIDKGVWCEVYYAGMGERGLAVQTPDSTDEARNRRAAYVLAMQKPAPGGKMPATGGWKKLSGLGTPMTNLPPLPDSYVKHKEEEEQKRLARRGGSCGGGGGSSSGGGGSSSDGPDTYSSGGSGGGSSSDGPGDYGSGGSGGNGGSEAPPTSGETPATKKGCNVDPSGGGAFALFGLFGMTAWRRRRRS